MFGWVHKPVAAAMATALMMPARQPVSAQAPQSTSGQVGDDADGEFVLKTNAELVLTNVVARDAKTGEFVRGLKQSDFYDLRERQSSSRSRRSIFRASTWRRR